MDKQLPCALKVEQEILGDMLTNKKNVARFIERLTVQDFYNDKHRKIFSHMIEMFAEGKTIGLTTFINKVGKSNLETVGSITYLSELSCAPAGVQADEYIKILKEKSFRRKSIREVQQALKNAYDDTKDINEVVGNMSNNLLQNEENSNLIDDKELMEITLNTVEDRFRNNGKLPGFKSGFKKFDLVTGGANRGELILIAGRPGAGKSAFVLNYADGLAKYGSKVGFISLEMTEEELGIRRLASNALIDMNKISFGNLKENDFAKIASTTNVLAKRNNIMFDCSSYQNLLTIRSKAMAIKQSKGLDVLIIDHCGLIQTKGKDVTREIGEISRGLKILAKELNIAVVLLSQLNRGVEARMDKRPMLSDLRDSGRLEEDANKVVMLYRDDYYNADTNDKDILEVIINKNRGGKVGTIKMAFKKEYQFICDLENDFE